MARIRSTAAYLAYYLLPALLLIGILVVGVEIAQAFILYENERTLVEERADAYAATATAIAPTITMTPTATLEGEVMADSFSISGQLFITNTPRPTSDASSAATPTPATDTSAEPTATPMPQLTIDASVFGTPGPVPTILFAEEPVVDPAAPHETAIPTSFPVIDRRGANLMNILLMGQDNEITGETLARTDTMIVVSINRDTNTVAMLSLPRDLFVYMPQVGMQRLNVGFAIGDSLGWDGGAFFYMRQVILYNLGINVHYFAMVDLSGFAELIDTVGGVDIAVDCPILDDELIGAEVPAAAEQIGPDDFLLPVGYYSFSGKEALWYARSRYNSDDFDRGRRQQQILRAAWRKVRDTGMLTDVAALPGLVSEGLSVVNTDLQAQDILGLLPVALQVEPEAIENFRFLRLHHTTPWTPQSGPYASQNVQLPNPDQVFDLMTDFYTPPTDNQISTRLASIRVQNGTPNRLWDKVAAERLGWSNMAAFAAGDADRTDYTSTVIMDYTSTDKGSSLGVIVEALNIKPENIIVQPDPSREVDFEVIVGADYNACTGNVLDPETGGILEP